MPVFVVNRADNRPLALCLTFPRRKTAANAVVLRCVGFIWQGNTSTAENISIAVESVLEALAAIWRTFKKSVFGAKKGVFSGCNRFFADNVVFYNRVPAV